MPRSISESRGPSLNVVCLNVLVVDFLVPWDVCESQAGCRHWRTVHSAPGGRSTGIRPVAERDPSAAGLRSLSLFSPEPASDARGGGARPSAALVCPWLAPRASSARWRRPSLSDALIIGLIAFSWVTRGAWLLAELGLRGGPGSTTGSRDG